MPKVAIPASGRLRPLSAGEWQQAGRVASRLRTDLMALIRALPEHAQGATGMSRHIGVQRVTCQRIVSALQTEDAGPELLVRLPGVKGLEQFLEGLARVQVDKREITLAETAVREFDKLLTELGGSQSKLSERLAMATQNGSEQSLLASESARANLYASAIGVTGRRCGVGISIYAFRAAPDDNTKLDRALVKGLIETSVMPGGMPMVLSSGDTLAKLDPDREDFRLLGDLEARGRTPEALLAPFTTSPLPTVTSRGKRGQLIQVIDPDKLDGEHVIDVVSANVSRHPMFDAEGDPTLNEVWSLVNCPTERLVLDVYLHRDMERQYRPMIDLQMWYPNLTSPGNDRWVTRFPAQPKLQLLGQGIGQSRSEAYARHAELTRYFFEQLGWDPEEYVGFRCEHTYPIWRAGYCMAFEYLGGR